MNLKQFTLNLRLSLYRKLPIKRNRIVFLSHLGKNYACNPRYICEYLAKNYPNHFDLVWIYDKHHTKAPAVPHGVRVVPYFTYEALRTIATSKFIISNTRISRDFYFEKRPSQIYIQTWHSSLRLKCIERDADLGIEYETFAKEDSNKIDVIFSGGGFSTQIFRNSFWYDDGVIINSGTPRIDWLLNAKQQQELILAKAKLLDSFNYILYAPTFRKGNSTEAYNIDFNALCNALQQKTGKPWKVLYRLHPNLKGKIEVNNSDVIIDMTDYDDIQELLVVANLLITDYSSSMFDAAFCSLPCILFASDLEKYITTERRLYFKIHDLPFPLAQTNEQLQSIINAFDLDSYQTKIHEFLQSIQSAEYGNACEQITQFIKERL